MQRVRAARDLLLLCALMLLALVTSCASPPPSTACPPLPTWTAEDQAATADELDAAVAAGVLDPEGPTTQALRDYLLLRDRVEVCQ